MIIIIRMEGPLFIRPDYFLVYNRLRLRLDSETSFSKIHFIKNSVFGKILKFLVRSDYAK